MLMSVSVRSPANNQPTKPEIFREREFWGGGHYCVWVPSRQYCCCWQTLSALAVLSQRRRPKSGTRAHTKNTTSLDLLSSFWLSLRGHHHHRLRESRRFPLHLWSWLTGPRNGTEPNLEHEPPTCKKHNVSPFHGICRRSTWLLGWLIMILVCSICGASHYTQNCPEYAKGDHVSTEPIECAPQAH